MSNADPAVERLRDAIAAFYAGGAGEAGAAAVLATAARALATAPPAPLTPRALPVAGLLPDALQAIADPALRPLAAFLLGAAPHFHWRQNPNYNADNMGAAFMAGYGYAEFAGPKGAFFATPTIRVGLLVLGPGRHYPPHAHPAEEVYHPLTAGAAWRRGSEAWRVVAPGEAIHHPPMIEHETRAGPATLLALYCWIGDTGTEARLTLGRSASCG